MLRTQSVACWQYVSSAFCPVIKHLELTEEISWVSIPIIFTFHFVPPKPLPYTESLLLDPCWQYKTAWTLIFPQTFVYTINFFSLARQHRYKFVSLQLFRLSSIFWLCVTLGSTDPAYDWSCSSSTHTVCSHHLHYQSSLFISRQKGYILMLQEESAGFHVQHGRPKRQLFPVNKLDALNGWRQ